jgi:hypothetical protein
VSAQPDGTAPQPPSGGGSQSLQATLSKVGEQSRERSPFMFLVVGLCFFLPFISISCSGQRIATMSGFQLVTGADVEVEESFLEEMEQLENLGGTADPNAQTPTPAPEETDPSVWAIVALAAAVLGVLVGFVTKGRTRAVGSLAAALAGLVGLIALRFDLGSDVSDAEGLVSVDYRIGYWIAALLFAVLGVAHGTFLRASRVNRPPSTGPPGRAP